MIPYFCVCNKLADDLYKL
uniref:Uncharacterized protein n=1 Tax=Anguilla anguilla TaxID=7936 RepID=A0A0E9S1Y9_ANGAN